MSTSMITRLLLSLTVLCFSFSSLHAAPRHAQWSPSLSPASPSHFQQAEPVRLESSQYANGSLGPYEYALYSIEMPRNDVGGQRELRISMTSFSGDAELFVTTDKAGIGPPSNSSYIWRGYDAGTSSLVINASDPNWCLDCQYWIAAYSHEYFAVFSLIATVWGSHGYIEAYRNHPVNILTPIGSWQGFFYKPRVFEQQHGIRITTTPSYGAAQVFVKLYTDDIDYNVSFPTPTDYTWKSGGSFAGSFTLISRDDPAYRTSCFSNATSPDDLNGCVLLIAVYQQFAHSTQYTLLVTQNSVDSFDPDDPVQAQHIRLVNHVPFIRSVREGEHEYYVTYQLERGSEFYVSLTRLSGSCSMFVSRDSQIEYPDETSDVNSVWSSDVQGTQSFSMLVNRPPGVLAALVYVGVRSWTNCTYTIVSNVLPPSRLGRFPARLTDGVPQYDSLMDWGPETRDPAGLNSWHYYVFYLPGNDSITLSISKHMGDVEVYAAGERWSRRDNYTDFMPPNQTNYDVSLADHGLTTYTWNEVPAGRLVIGVHARYRADYIITVTAAYTDQVLLANQSTTGYLRPFFVAGQWAGYTAQYVYLLDNMLPHLPPLALTITELSGHVDIFVSDTNPGWFINGSDPTSYNWTQSYTRFETILVNSTQLRPGPYWIKVYAWEPSTFTITAGYANTVRLQVGVPQSNWMPPNVSHYYAVTVPGTPNQQGAHGHDLIATLLPLWGRCAMVYNYIDPSRPFVLPDHHNVSTFDVVNRGNYPGLVWHEMQINNYDCPEKRCTYLIEVYSFMEQDCRYNLQTFSFNTSDSNNQSAVIQHTVPQLTHIGEGWSFTQQSHYTFHVPLDYSTVTFALTRLGNIFNGELAIAIHRCFYPGRPDEGEWHTELQRGGPVIRIDPDSQRFSNRTHIPCGLGRQTPYGQAGVYYVTIFNYGSEADFTVALSIRSLFSRYTNESSVVLVNTLPQVGFAPWPQAEYFRMFQLVPGQQIHIALPEHSLLYHSITEPYPNRSNTPDFKDSRLDDEWVEWPLNATVHYFGIQSGEDIFYIVPTLYNGTNDTSVVSWLDWANMQEGRAFPGQVTHYQFYIADEPADFNLSYVDITMDITAGNPHLYLNWAPFNGPSQATNITFPSRDNNMWNITDPNFPVLRIQFPQKGRYLLSVVPSNRSQAQAEWRLTVRRPWDFTVLHDGWQRSDWLWHNTTAYHVIHMPRRDDSWPYAELRISFTSWYGDAEIFVSNGPLSWPSSDGYIWRGYDAGTASLVINSTDPMFCYDCDYYIAVLSNEVASYYSIAATVYGNWSAIALTNHVPISLRTPVNGTQRLYYVPKNYELQHGFRIHVSPAYGAATFAINVIERYAYAGREWPYPNASTAANATWTSYGFFEGSAVHVSHLDPGFCRSQGGLGSPDDRSNCIYLITVFEGTGGVDAAYSLLLQSQLVDPSLLPPDNDNYDPIQEPHNRLLNHVPIQQYAETGNITYYKSITVNNATAFYFSLTVLAGWADVYASTSVRYPNSTVNDWSSLRANTTAFSFITSDAFSFTEIFFAVEAHINSSYTMVAGQYSFNRLGRFPLRLTNGVPQYDTLDLSRRDLYPDSLLHYWRYFVYYLPVDDDLLFSINKIVGEPRAYIAYDPLLSANNASYTQFSIPSRNNYAQAMEHFGLDTIAWNRATAGRYVIGVHCDRVCDYQISVTAHFTHQVLTKDLPMAGVLLPYSAGVDDYRSAARYVVYQAETTDRNLSIVLTTLSGLAHVFVSDITWDIDPMNASSYRWNATTHPYQINIPASDTRQGPYWILVHAWQNTTYTMLATEFFWTGLQLGLPQTVGAQANASHVYAIAVPGGREDGQWLGVAVLPLYGRAWMYSSNITSNFSAAIYPNHSDPKSYERWSADPFDKPQLVWYDARECFNRRCSFLFEVNCPFSDCYYTINAFPWSDEHWNPSRTTILLEQHVPQFGYLDLADDDFDGASMQHYEFHIPDDHSTAVLAFTRQYGGSDPERFTNAVLAISRFEFPTCMNPECSEFPVFHLGEQPVIVIDWRDRVFNRSTAGSNRTQAGVYYVTLWNQDQREGLFFTLALTIRDDVYADNKGLILVDTVAQLGVNRPGDDPTNYYRLYKHSAEAITHIKLSGDLELFHNNGSGWPYPRWDNGAQDSLSSATALEWLEWPVTAGAHFFGVVSSDWQSPYYLLPYFADGQNATNVRQWLQWGTTRVGRLPANHTIYFRLALDNASDWQSIELRLEPVSGSPLAWINHGQFVHPLPGEPDSNTVYPSWLNYQWTINNTDAPFASISPVRAGEYLIAVHAYHDAEASFRITANLRGKDNRQTWTDLRSGEVTSHFMANNSYDLYRIVVPEQMRRDQDHRIKISLTSWYGEAEFFVARGEDELNASHFQWRTYDAGTASVIIDDHDGDECRDGVCSYFVAVFANEITAYYDLFATFGANSQPWIQLTNHLPLNAALGPGRDPNDPHAPPGMPDMVLFTFTPKNYQLRHGLRIHTMPAYGAAYFAVNVISASNATAGWLWPDRRNATWQAGGLFSGSYLHIPPTDPNFCSSNLKNWTGPTGDSDCIYLIAVVASEYDSDTQFTILATTYTPEEDLPRGLRPGTPAFTEREPHVRLLNNVPIAFFQANGTWNYFKAFTNQPWTETVLTLTCISGWADFYVDDWQPFPNASANYNWFNSHDANVSTVQFIVYQNYSWDELFIGVRAWTNVTYTITLSQYPTERLGRFPMRLIDGVPQADTLTEYDMGSHSWLNSWRYYVFYQTERDQELRLSITRFMGEVEVYVLQQPFDWRRPYGQNWTQFDLPPFAYNHTLNDHGLDALSIPHVGPGRFVIAVHAGRRADYTITVAKRFTPMLLMKDVPTPGHIRPADLGPQPGVRSNYTFQVYGIFIPDAYDRDLVIGVTVLSGHCDLFALSINTPQAESLFLNSTDGVRLQQVVIPAAYVRAGHRDWLIVVANNDNATFQILVSDYYFAQLQLGLPSNAWLRAGDSHLYGITVPGGEEAHDLLISATPLLGRAYLFGTNITTSFKQPAWPNNASVDFFPVDPYSSLDVLYLNNHACQAARCTYLVQVYCSQFHGSYCRYGLQAIPWTTMGVSNTSIVLQDTVPQLGFTGVFGATNNPFNVSMTHYVFHVPNAHSNVSVQLTDLDPAGPMRLAVSRRGFPNTTFSSGQFFGSPVGADSSIVFDYTNALFTSGQLQQAGVYYMTVFARLRPAAYLVTLDIVDDTNRHNASSAITLMDGQRQAGYQSRNVHRTLYTFVSPRVEASRNEVPKAITIDLQRARSGPFNFTTLSLVLPDLFITWDGSVPTPDHFVFSLTAADVTSSLVLYPGRPLNCDNTKQDCVYTIAAYKPSWFNESRDAGTRYSIMATAGNSFLELHDGESVTNWAVVGAQANYTFFIGDGFDPNDNYDLTVTVTPLRLFCSAVAYISHEGYPDVTNPRTARTNYTQGVRTVHLRRAQPGLYVIAVYAYSDSDPYCQFTMSVTTGLVVLEDGNPFADYLPGLNATSNRNESWRWYRFPQQDYFAGQVLTFQLDPLSPDSRLNLFVKYDSPNHNEPWPWQSLWNSTGGNGTGHVISIRPDSQRTFVIAVECVRENGDCAYELTAQAGLSHRVLQDGVQINAAQPLRVGEYAYYRAYASPDSGYKTGLTIALGRIYGEVSAYASFTERRPSNVTAPHHVYVGPENASFMYIPYEALVNGGNYTNRTGYIWISVRGEGPDMALYTISASLSATFLQQGEQTVGWCYPGRDALFIFNLDSLHPVLLQATEVYPREASLQVSIRDRNNDSALAVWGFESWGLNRSAYLAPWDQRLQACVAFHQGCTLIFNISGCQSETVFILYADDPERPIRMTDDDEHMLTLINGNDTEHQTVGRFEVGVSNPRRLDVYVESCWGAGVSAYMNYPSPTAAWPSSTSYNQQQPYAEQLLRFDLGTDLIQKDAFYRITVVPKPTQGLYRFRVVTNTIRNISFPALIYPMLTVSPSDHGVTVSFIPAVQGNYGPQLLYSLYYVDDALTNQAALYTVCGVMERGVTPAVSWTFGQVQALVPSGGRTATYTVGGLNPELTYRFGLIVRYENFTNGAWTGYVPSYEVKPMQSGGGSDTDKVAEDAGAVILGVVLPITLILAGIALYLYIRNRRLQQELSVELPDVSATPSSASARRRAQRGPDVGGDAFSRGGGDMYNSLLGEEESAGDDKRRTGRAARKAQSSNGGARSASNNGDLPEDSDVAYRSDVI